MSLEDVVVDLRLAHPVETVAAPAPVPDHRAFKVRDVAVNIDLIHQHGNVQSGVGLAGDKEVVARVLRESFEPVDEELVAINRRALVSVHALRCHAVSVGRRVAVAEADALRLLEIKYISDGRPRVRVVEQLRRRALRHVQ